MSSDARVFDSRGRWATVVCLVATLALSSTGVLPASAEQADEPTLPSRREFQAALDAIVEAGVPGVIGLARDGRKVLRLASGVADVETGRPITPRDRYRIGSETKSFTATVVLQLVGEGRLRLRDSVERWLPGLVPNGRNITVRMLLNHTSGLYNFTEDPRVFEPYEQGNLDFVWRPRQLIRIATSHPPLFPPGTDFNYTNTEYVLLGLIVRAVTGEWMSVQLKRRIFQPLGLTRTTYPIENPYIRGPHSHGYILGSNGELEDITSFPPSPLGAAGAIVSTVTDVARFYRALLGGRLLEPAQLRAMQTLVDTGIPGVVGYGLGLFALELPCGVAWGHNGEVPGFYNIAMSTKDGDRQVVLMRNLESPSAAALEAFSDALEIGFCGKAS